MAWDNLSVTPPHLVYIVLGGVTALFMLCSSLLKERLYLGEAPVATVVGVIFGPSVTNLINPLDWGATDVVTIEFSRIVLVVQCFAVGVELPRFYVERHWRSIALLLLPAMAWSWLVTSLLAWWAVPSLSWLEALVIAACVTPTDPIIASSVIGKGKFARRVPQHLRHLLSAESCCNDGVASLFLYLSLFLLRYKTDRDLDSADAFGLGWFCRAVLYQCVLGAVYGFVLGYAARRGVRFAEGRDLIDRESFLVFYFVLALFCAGSGSILGLDDLLVGFAAGVGFSNDGWFRDKTEESHVSDVIDLLLNLTYFVYLGTIIPWHQFNSPLLGLYVWRLVVLAVLVILLRRLPALLLLKPLIPDVKTWREAFFVGHFGPIGGGAVFMALLARAELEHDRTEPLAQLPASDAPHYRLIGLVWPVVTFLVVASIVVHGSSVAVFALGKRINTLTVTLSYNSGLDDFASPSWMTRLPRLSQSRSRSRSRAPSEAGATDADPSVQSSPEYPPGALPLAAASSQFLIRRQHGQDRPAKHWDEGIGPGGPVAKSAIHPRWRATNPPPPPVPLSPFALPLPLFAPPSSAPLPRSYSSLVPFPPPAPAPASLSSPAIVLPPSTPIFTSPSSPPRLTPLASLSLPPLRHLPASSSHQHQPRHDDTIETFISRDGGRESPATDGNSTTHGEKQTTSERTTHWDSRPTASTDVRSRSTSPQSPHLTAVGVGPGAHRQRSKSEGEQHFHFSFEAFRRKMADVYHQELEKRKEEREHRGSHEPGLAYQFGHTIIVEDAQGEVVKTYELPSHHRSDHEDGTADGSTAVAMPHEHARRIRFTIGEGGHDMTEDDFISEVQNLALHPHPVSTHHLPPPSHNHNRHHHPHQPSHRQPHQAAATVRPHDPGGSDDETPAERGRREPAPGREALHPAPHPPPPRERRGIRFAELPVRPG